MQIIPLMNVTSCAVIVPVWNLMTYAMEKMIARTSLTKIYVVSLHGVKSRENSIQIYNTFRGSSKNYELMKRHK